MFVFLLSEMSFSASDTALKAFGSSVIVDSDGHVAAEGEEEPELSGAVRPSAGFLFGVRHGEF